MSANLDRELLHQRLQEVELIEVLERLRGDQAAGFHRAVTAFGQEVKQAVDAEVMMDLNDSLEIEGWLVGYVALLYEAENNKSVEEELDRELIAQ